TRLLLVEGRKSLPLAPRLLEPHAPADDLGNRKPRAQLVEEMRRKAHEAGLVIRWASQYRPAPGPVGTGADCPGYPQGAGGWGRHKAKYGPAFAFAPFRTTGRIPSKLPSKIAPTTSLREDMDDFNQRRSHDPPRRAGKRRRRCRRSGFGQRASIGADRRAEDLCPRARRLARRLVLASRGRSSAKARAQGVHADDDGVGRALAP